MEISVELHVWAVLLPVLNNLRGVGFMGRAWRRGKAKCAFVCYEAKCDFSSSVSQSSHYADWATPVPGYWGSVNIKFVKKSWEINTSKQQYK